MLLDVTCNNCGKALRRRRAYLTYFCDNTCRQEHSTRRIADRIAHEDATNTRYCPKCKLTLCLDDFWPNKARQDGLSSWCRHCSHQDTQQRYKAHPERKRDINWRASIKYNHGISEKEYNKLREAQFSCCAICETVFLPGCAERLCVDHDHDTGAIRGLICRTCNSALGLFKEDHVVVQKAADYLREKSPDTRERRINEALADLNARLEKQSLQGVVLKLAEEDR